MHAPSLRNGTYRSQEGLRNIVINSLVFPRTHVVTVADGRGCSRSRRGRLRSAATSHRFRRVAASATGRRRTSGRGDALGYRGRRFVCHVLGGSVAPVVPVHGADVNDGRHALFPRQRQRLHQLLPVGLVVQRRGAGRFVRRRRQLLFGRPALGRRSDVEVLGRRHRRPVDRLLRRARGRRPAAPVHATAAAQSATPPQAAGHRVGLALVRARRRVVGRAARVLARRRRGHAALAFFGYGHRQRPLVLVTAAVGRHVPRTHVVRHHRGWLQRFAAALVRASAKVVSAENKT